ncbi:hypothetical protein E3N88_06260 [Mikania micrantha]|uniref:Uncharacterized protein n=1 Tax=Mikania micrantha TaxID=192012 RepID=A0A5N6PN86_9ASTR|nr:hypothetical protein E3N88_06260 [Mikania micrantha]
MVSSSCILLKFISTVSTDKQECVNDEDAEFSIGLIRQDLSVPDLEHGEQVIKVSTPSAPPYHLLPFTCGQTTPHFGTTAWDTRIPKLSSICEYIKLASHLASCGISHLTSPPHTPEHNDFAERHHRHIVETGLTLLSHAQLPLKFWPFAFTTATYLINRLPTITLNNDSPFSRLFHKLPNYDKLRSFGCLCYPWLRPYTTHKLQSRSKPCIFVGYSPTQSAYHLLDPQTNKIYTSRHVQFVESQFPYSSLTKTSPPTYPNPTHWLPLSISSIPAPSQPPSNPPPTASTPTNQPIITYQRRSKPPNPLPTPSLPVHSDNPSPNLPNSPSSSENSPPPPSNPPSPSSPPHTRTFKPPNPKYHNQDFLLYHSTPQLFPEPSTSTQALKQPHWRHAMQEEFNALTRNQTWSLVPPDSILNLVGCKWVFRTKFKPDGSVDRFKARLVAKGFHQRPGLDYVETFSPVIKPATLRIILTLATSQSWPLRQLDINNAFLQGVEVLPHTHGLFLSQSKYITDLLSRANMTDCKPSSTPINSSTLLLPSDGTPLSSPTEYRALVGALQYLSLTRPDVAFTVNKLSQFMHTPTDIHFTALKRLLRYLHGTMHHGLLIRRHSPLLLHAFTDADWAGDKQTYRSTTGYLVYLGSNPISWSSKRQSTLVDPLLRLSFVQLLLLQ